MTDEQVNAVCAWLVGLENSDHLHEALDAQELIRALLTERAALRQERDDARRAANEYSGIAIALRQSLDAADASLATLRAELKSTKDRMWENGHALDSLRAAVQQIAQEWLKRADDDLAANPNDQDALTTRYLADELADALARLSETDKRPTLEK